MSTALVEKAEKEVNYMADGEEVKLSFNTVKNYLVRGQAEKVSSQEVVMFINLCKYQKLNPFLNEAYLVKFGEAAAQIVVGKEAFMKRAEESKEYAGFKAGIIVKRGEKVLNEEGTFMMPGDSLLGGWCEVYRRDREHPILSRVSLAEYNKSQSTWKSMPSTMIRKTAMVQALREAFPKDLGAMYAEEEVVKATPQEEVQKNANQEEFAYIETDAIETPFEDDKEAAPTTKPNEQVEKTGQIKIERGF